jgi:hypothetical protein
LHENSVLIVSALIFQLSSELIIFLKKELVQNNRVELKVMKKQLVIIGFVALLIFVGINGCSSLTSDKDKFVGTWKTSLGVTSVLFSDGTCTIAGVSGTWDVKDNMLIIVLANLPTQSTFSYAFSDSDKTVTLTDKVTGISTVYTKQ